jgi:hypothetical protein
MFMKYCKTPVSFIEQTRQAVLNIFISSNIPCQLYCHVFSDCRRGIGMTTGFIGSTLTTRGYTLQFPVTHTH